MSIFDKVVADLAPLDERLSLAAPVCFICGKAITRLNFVSVDSPAFTPVHAHQECANAVGGPAELAERARRAIEAAHSGQAEVARMKRSIVRGGFL